MIGILSNNIDETFLQKLDKPYTIIDDPSNFVDLDGLFIDWVPKTTEYEGAWMEQASLLQTFIKSGISIVIFDRFFSLTEKEVKWVKKFNVKLFEPAINSDRIGFDYLPEWINNCNFVENNNREYDLVYSNEQLEYRIAEFEKWIKDYSRLFPDKKVAYFTNKISEFKAEEYKKDNLILLDTPVYAFGKSTIALDNEKSYKIGHLDSIVFFAMKMGCMPILPAKHKYFHGLFEGLIAHDLQEMNYYVSALSKVKNVVIEEIFDRLKDEWSEFLVDHATDVIRNCYE